jgi:Zn-dependent protease with chaperone function
MTGGIDFDFARYIQEKRGQQMLRARDGAAYSYTGERKVRRTLASARPVTMSLEATTRLWRDVARAELLGASVKATDEVYPRVFAAAKRAAEALRMKAPAVYVAPATWALRARALGTDDAPYLVVNASLAEQLTDPEMVAAIGHELAHVQNGHVLYATALHYLTSSAVFFVRWIVQPAIMTLQAWSRRAEITCDRAALLANRDLDSTLRGLIKLELGLDQSFDLDEYLAAEPEAKKGLGRFGELFRAHPYLPKRIAALRLFAEGAFFAVATGADPEGKPSAEEIDRKVADILAVF